MIENKLIRRSLLMGLFAFIYISSFGQTYIGDKEELKIILTNIDKFSTFVMNSDYQNIGNSYTANAKIFPNNRDIISGTHDIINYWKLPEGVRITHHKITPQEIKISGNEAYDYGYYAGTTLNIDGSQSSWRGKYVIVWRKVDKDWKMYLDIWNRIVD